MSVLPSSPHPSSSQQVKQEPRISFASLSPHLYCKKCKTPGNLYRIPKNTGKLVCKYIVYDEKGGAGICGNIITVDGGAPLQAIQVEAVVEEARKNEIERPPLKRERENEEEKDGRKEMCYKCKHRVNTDDDATGRQYMEFNLQNENTFKIKKEAARHIPHWSRIIADMEKNQIWSSINITDETPADFNLLADWLNQSLELRVNEDTYATLLRLAHKYNLPALANYVEADFAAILNEFGTKQYDAFVLAVKHGFNATIIQKLRERIEVDLAAFLDSHMGLLMEASADGRVMVLELYKKLREMELEAKIEKKTERTT